MNCLRRRTRIGQLVREIPPRNAPDGSCTAVDTALQTMILGHAAKSTTARAFRPFTSGPVPSFVPNDSGPHVASNNCANTAFRSVFSIQRRSGLDNRDVARQGPEAGRGPSSGSPSVSLHSPVRQCTDAVRCCPWRNHSSSEERAESIRVKKLFSRVLDGPVAPRCCEGATYSTRAAAYKSREVLELQSLCCMIGRWF